jgi:hypothetical protein
MATIFNSPPDLEAVNLDCIEKTTVDPTAPSITVRFVSGAEETWQCSTIQQATSIIEAMSDRAEGRRAFDMERALQSIQETASG